MIISASHKLRTEILSLVAARGPQAMPDVNRARALAAISLNVLARKFFTGRIFRVRTMVNNSAVTLRFLLIALSDLVG